MNKKNLILLFAIFFATFFSWKYVSAQENLKVDYAGQVAVDSDLDGLTDQGEIQVFRTDPSKTDTDGDSYGDGVEVLAGTDPLNEKLYPGSRPEAPVAEQTLAKVVEIPVPWYISRASGLVAFLLLYLSIFLGLTLRIPLLRKIFLPIYSMKIHCWLSLQALFFAFVHAIALIFDKWLGFKLVDLFVPFASQYQPSLTTLGVLGFYLMAVMIATSYGKKFISYKIWRFVHFTNLVLYGVVFVHALYLGTDLKVELFRNIFILANAFLVFLMLFNLELRIADAFRIRKQKQEALNNSRTI
jgi:methionine sulfoxide reductase heme-binding subunit